MSWEPDGKHRHETVPIIGEPNGNLRHEKVPELVPVFGYQTGPPRRELNQDLKKTET